MNLNKTIFLLYLASALLLSCNKEDTIPEVEKECLIPYQYLHLYKTNIGVSYPKQSTSNLFPLISDYFYGGYDINYELRPYLTASLASSSNIFCSQGTGKFRINSFLIHTTPCYVTKDDEGFHHWANPWEGSILTTDDEQTFKTNVNSWRLNNSTGILHERDCLYYSFAANSINSDGSFQLPLSIKVHQDCTFELYDTDTVTQFVPGSNMIVRIHSATNSWRYTDILDLSSRNTQGTSRQEVGLELQDTTDIQCN